MLKIILYCKDKAGFEKQKTAVSEAGFGDLELLFGNSEAKSREQLINENQNCWLLFLDHDCVPTEWARAECERLVSQSGNLRPIVFAGGYDNPEGASLLQLAHNKIANTWLEHSYSARQHTKVLLGGNFLICAVKKIDLPKEKFWGAEDKLLARELKSAGYELHLNEKLKVVHATNKSFSHFLKRAFVHGRHDAVYFGDEKGAKIFYWIQKTGFSDLRLVPLILLHFCIQKAAKTVQKVLPPSKQKR